MSANVYPNLVPKELEGGSHGKTALARAPGKFHVRFDSVLVVQSVNKSCYDRFYLFFFKKITWVVRHGGASL